MLTILELFSFLSKVGPLIKQRKRLNKISIIYVGLLASPPSCRSVGSYLDNIIVCMGTDNEDVCLVCNNVYTHCGHGFNWSDKNLFCGCWNESCFKRSCLNLWGLNEKLYLRNNLRRMEFPVISWESAHFRIAYKGRAK